MKRGLKNFLIVISCFLILCCVAIDVWYLSILLYGPDKVLSYTHEIGFQTVTDEDGTETNAHFIELNYFANSDNSGLEAFEIKFNYMLDETQTAFYSQGLQYVSEPNEKLNFDYQVAEGQGNGKHVSTYNTFLTYYYVHEFWGAYQNTNGNEYNYASSDDYEHTIFSTNPISASTLFKIQLGDELFLMKFKNADTIASNENFVYENSVLRYSFVYSDYQVNRYYTYYDVNYFVKILYDSIKALPSGTNSTMVFEFGNLFDYYKYDETTGQYSETVIGDEAEKLKIVEDIKSYYTIKVNTSSKGIQSASESLFNCVNGSTTYNTIPGGNTDDYFIGRSYLEVTEKDFDLVEIEPGYCVLKLKENFINYYSKYDTLILKINVNLDRFVENQITILGFANDSGLSDFEVSESYFSQTIDGTLTQWEVEYA